MARARVLVIEDDESYQEFYRAFFVQFHSDKFEWRLAQSGEAAIRLLQRKSFDLIVLDIGLPGKSGLDVLRWREKDPGACLIPALVVSGGETTQDRVTGLDVGADDYLVKPFADEELLARLAALKRRRDRICIGHGLYDLGWLKFDPESHQLAVDDALVHLEPKELDILLLFLRRPRIIHRPHALWDMFWDEENRNFEHVLENKVSSLRRKLGPGGVYLRNHKGIGYSFDPSEVVAPA